MEIVSFPLNVLVYVSKFLPIPSILKFGLTCKRLSKILENEFLWKLICERDFGKELDKDGELNWKQFAKEGFFEWESVPQNEGVYTVSHNKKRVFNKSRHAVVCTILSKNIYRKGKITFDLENYVTNPASHTFGVASANYSSYLQYVLFTSSSVGVTAEGYTGNECNTNLFRLERGTRQVRLIIDLKENKMQVCDKDAPEKAYSAEITKIAKGGVKLALTITYPQTYVHVKSVKIEN